MSVRSRSSDAAVSPAGPAPIMTAVFLGVSMTATYYDTLVLCANYESLKWEVDGIKQFVHADVDSEIDKGIHNPQRPIPCSALICKAGKKREKGYHQKKHPLVRSP